MKEKDSGRQMVGSDDSIEDNVRSRKTLSPMGVTEESQIVHQNKNIMG
jgi:hypothetical protein